MVTSEQPVQGVESELGRIVPVPEFYVNQANADLALYIGLLVLVFVGGWCAWQGIKDRDWIPFLAVAGAAISILMEPMWDILCQFAFAFDTQPIAFTAFGRPIPLYLPLCYIPVIGLGAYVNYRAFLTGNLGMLTLSLFSVFYLLDAVIEIIGTNAQLWLYYGEHYIRVFDWPVLYGFLNTTISIVAGALFIALRSKLQGMEKGLLIFVVPTAYAVVYGVAGWPTWVALGWNGDIPTWVVWAAQIVSIGLCLAMIAGVKRSLLSAADTSVTAAPSTAQLTS